MNFFTQGPDPVLGTWVSIPHHAVIENMAQSGFDFLLLDGEHAPIAPTALGDLLTAAERHGARTVYRVPAQRDEYIKAALDAGVSGVMVPMVNGADEAQAVVAAGRYPPLGQRGIGPWRASNYFQDYDAYLASVNDQQAIIVQIETATAVEQASAIAAVEGIDVLYVGPADLASNLGYPIGASSPEFLDVCEHVAKAANAKGKRAGIDIIDASAVPLFVERGFSLFTYGMDATGIRESTDAAMGALRGTLDAGGA